jgi:hypothetical protein
MLDNKKNLPIFTSNRSAYAHTHTLSLSLSARGDRRAALASISLLLTLLAAGSASAQVIIKDTVVISPGHTPASPESQLIWYTPEWADSVSGGANIQTTILCAFTTIRTEKCCLNLPYGRKLSVSVI